MEYLNPYFVTGFTEGEGSFYVGVLPRNLEVVSWEVRPSFSLSQNSKNKKIVFLLKDFFDCGWVRPSKGDDTVKYEVRSLKDLSEKIIPHFEKYPLKGEKLKDFIAFKEIVEIMQKEKHLKKDGLSKIVELAISMVKHPKRTEFLKNIHSLLKV